MRNKKELAVSGEKTAQQSEMTSRGSAEGHRQLDGGGCHSAQGQSWSYWSPRRLTQKGSSQGRPDVMSKLKHSLPNIATQHRSGDDQLAPGRWLLRRKFNFGGRF